MEEFVAMVADALGARFLLRLTLRAPAAARAADRMSVLGPGGPQPQFAADKPAFFPSVCFGAISV
eukprot:3889196-Rhodomonas_salina.4